MKTYKRPWTNQDDDDLVKLAPGVPTGCPPVAKTLGRSVEACKIRLALVRNATTSRRANWLEAHNASADEVAREAKHIAKVLGLGGFPVLDMARPGRWLWPMRVRRVAA